MPDGAQSPDKKTLSRRDFLKLGGLGLGVLALAAEEIKYGIVRKWLSAEFNLSTTERKRYQQAVEGLFAPVTDEESQQAFAYYEQTEYQKGEGEAQITNFSLTTPDDLKGNCAMAINREKIDTGQVGWFIFPLEPGSFSATLVNNEGELSQHLTLNPMKCPSIELGEPNQGGFASESPDFKGNSLKSLLGKDLAAVGLWKLLDIKDRVLELAGYSGGANAALTVAAHFPESIKRLITFSSTYNLLSGDLKNRVLQMLDNQQQRKWVTAWTGEEVVKDLLDFARGIGDEKALNIKFSDLRKLMIQISPYYFVDRIPLNSFKWEISHGRNDQITPFSQATELVSRLKELGWDEQHLQVSYHDGDHF